MRLLFWVNDPREVLPSQTTSMLITTAIERGHEVWVCGVAHLSLDGRGRITARAHQVQTWPGELPPAQTLDVLTCEAVLIRTNPARDAERAAAHETALIFGEALEARGVVVLNRPAGIRTTRSKLFLATLPQRLRPRSTVSGDPAELLEVVTSSEEPCVAKPLLGTRGSDVFKLSKDDPNLKVILASLCAEGPALLQDFAPGAEQGDLRLLVLEGEPLQIEGDYACVQRVPGQRDWRSNIHCGGTPTQGAPTPEQLAAARELGQILLDQGVFLAGLDLIGPLAIELNVFSTGGLRDANRFFGRDFTVPILAALERRVATPSSNA